jgi:hypothetical protein
VPCGPQDARSVEGIDYVTLRLPMEGAEGVHGGYLIFVSAQGEKEGEARRWRGVEGAHGATIQARHRRGNLEIRGNPYAFLHGHNLGGEPDLLLLVEESVESLCERLQMRLSPRVRRALRAGEYVLGRVDVQRSTWLESTAQVRALIDAQACAAAAARMKLYYEPGESLIVSPRSRYASVSLYAKQLEARKSLSRDLPEREMHLAAVAGVARYEARLWAMWLRRRNLDRAAAWSPAVVTAVLDEQIARLPVLPEPVLGDARVAHLAPKTQLLYYGWKNGLHLRTIFGEKALRPHRRAVRAALAIDIAHPRSPAHRGRQQGEHANER